MTVSLQNLSTGTFFADNLTKPPPFDSAPLTNANPSPLSLSPSPTTPGPSLSSSIASLPGYTASLPVPDYRPNPNRDEQRLAFVPTRSIYGRSTGVWTKRVKDMTINLHNQDPIGVQSAPKYGRRGIISGTIEFDKENLAAFEKVKLVVRPPCFTCQNIQFLITLD